ncbi:MAG: hypothetical protein AB7E67_16285, partial [Xanthobacteraceae bacterium]
ETQGYVKTITGNPVENWSASSARHPAQKVPEEAPCQHVAGLLAANGPDALPLPTPSPLRASVKVADKGQDKAHDKKPAKVEAKADGVKSESAKAETKKPAAEKKALDLKIIAAEPQAKKNGRVALGAGKDKATHHGREEVRLTVKPAAKADLKAETKSEPKSEPRKHIPKREKIAQR